MEHHLELGSDSLLVCGSKRRLFIERFLMVGFRDRHLVGAASRKKLECKVAFARVERFTLALQLCGAWCGCCPLVLCRLSTESCPENNRHHSHGNTVLNPHKTSGQHPKPHSTELKSSSELLHASERSFVLQLLPQITPTIW